VRGALLRCAATRIIMLHLRLQHVLVFPLEIGNVNGFMASRGDVGCSVMGSGVGVRRSKQARRVVFWQRRPKNLWKKIFAFFYFCCTVFLKSFPHLNHNYETLIAIIM
jgi:hypothetical protein